MLIKRKKGNLIPALVLIFAALVFTLIFALIFNFKYMRQVKKTTVRPLAFSGQFYPADTKELEGEVKNYLASAPAVSAKGEVKIIMVPHAGYDYSAAVAAVAYKALAGEKIKRVFLLGNSHHHYFPGVAVDDSDIWQGPFGDLKVDKAEAAALIKASSLIQVNRAVHADEHGLEVQLPFLETVFGHNFKIIPLLFGNSGGDDYETLAEVLAKELKAGDLVVVSSDMSHYPPYALANKIDRETLSLIENKDLAALSAYAEEALNQEAGEDTILCGLDGVKTTLVLADKLNLTPVVADYKNSGDTVFGDKNAVVGYGAVLFLGSEASPVGASLSEISQAAEAPLNAKQQAALLAIAKQSVETYVKDGSIPDFQVSDPRLKQIQGAFVTLTKNGDLRGCIGQIIADEALWQVVRDMAMAAATEDGRFLPVSVAELAQLSYEVSVLSPPKVISDWREIKLGRDGVIVKKGGRSGVFLPQVATETGWSLEEFLSQLCAQKAGLPSDCYKSGEAELSVFQAQVF